MRKFLIIIVLIITWIKPILGQQGIVEVNESLRPACANENVFYEAGPIATPAPCTPYYDWRVTGGTIYDAQSFSSKGSSYTGFDITNVMVRWSSTATDRSISLSVIFAEIQDGNIAYCTATGGQATYSVTIRPDITGIINSTPPSVPIDSYNARFDGSNVGSNLCSDQSIRFSWDLPTPAQGNFRIENRIIAEIGGSVAKELSGWSVTNISTSKTLPFTGSNQQVIIKAESRYRDCPDRTATVELARYNVYRTPTATQGTHSPPSCPGGNDGVIRFTDVSSDFNSYIISIYKGRISDIPYEVLNIEKDDALSGNSITLQSGTPIANIIDDAGNSSTTSRTLQLDAGIYTLALEPNVWPDGAAVPENVCYRKFEVEVPPSPEVEFVTELNNGQATLDLICSDDVGSLVAKANRPSNSNSDLLDYYLYKDGDRTNARDQKLGIPENTEVTFSGLPDGSYEVAAVYDDCNEIFSETVVTISRPETPLSLNSPSRNPPTCVDGKDGSLVIGPTGGNGAYNNIRVRVTGPDSYSESQIYVRGGDDLTFSGLTGGETYTVEMDIEVPENSRNYSCLVSEDVDIRNPDPIQTSNEDEVAPTCPGGNDGFYKFKVVKSRSDAVLTFTAVTAGGVSKTVSGPDASNFYYINGLKGGDAVEFTVNEEKGGITCSEPFTGLPIPSNNGIPLSITLKGIPGDCYTDDGSIEISLTGGEGPFTISLDGTTILNGATNEFERGDFPHTITGLTPLESHTIRVTDDANNGSGSAIECFDEKTITIDELFEISAGDRPTPNGNSTYQIRCYDELAPVTFTLSGYGTGQGLAVYDQSDNEIDTLSRSLTGATGTIMFPEGNFTVKGIDQNCTTHNSESISINRVDNPLEFVVATDTILFSSEGTDYSVSKFGVPDGVIKVEVQGGLESYTLELLIDGNPVSGEVKSSVTPNNPVYFDSLKAKDTDGELINYSVRVIDQLLCSEESDIINLTEPYDLILTTSINTYKGNVNIKCAGGNDTIFVSSQGGIFPQAFSLTNNNTGEVLTDTIFANGSTSTYFAGIEFGDYTVNLLDKSSSNYDSDLRDTDNENVTLIEPSAITYTTEMVEPTCFGGNDGSYTVTPSGGVPYAFGEYLIKFYDENKVELDAFTTRASSATLVSDSGSYYYTVQDTLSGCDTIYHAFDIVEWPRLVIDTLVTEYPLCYGDSTAKLNVYIKNGRPLNDTYGVVLYDSTNSRIDSLVTDTNGYTLFEDLFSGEYYVTVYDSALCSYKDTIYVEERKDPLEISQTEKQASTCANSDNAKLKVYSAGGDVMHYYSIDNGASWRTPKPGNIYVGADNKVDSAFVVFDSLESGGIYEVLLKDNNYYAQSFENSCLISKTDTISITPQLLLNVEKEDVSCYDATDGSLSIYPSYGDEKGLSFFDIKVLKNGDLFAENILELTDLAPANYKVEVRLSAKGACGVVARKEVSISRPPLPLYADIQSTTNYNCANPSEIIVRGNVEGGWPKNGYEYKFNNGTYESFIPDGAEFRFTESLTIGEHVLTIRDSKGCEESTSFTVEPLMLDVEVLKQTDVSCYGGNDGLLQLTSANGNLAYKLWNSTDSFKIAATDTALFDAVPTGNFQLVASSGSCISDTLNFTFNSPDEIAIDYTILNQPTCGEANGEVVTNISGGVAPYTTNWLYKGGQLLAANALMAGDYIVIVEDAMGCQKRDSVYLAEQTDLSATVADISRATCGAANASVTLNITGGVPGYIIEWYNSQNALVGNGSLLSNISKGTYYYQLSDQSGCAITDTVFVGGDEVLSVSIANATQATCGIANGSVDLSVTGGNAPYTVNWPTTIPVTNGLSASGLKGGIVYEVLVTDSSNCEQTFKFSINNTSGPELSINQFNPSCGSANGTIELTSITGKEPLSITWNGVADTSRLKTGLGEGTYSITVTDADSCSTTKVVELEEDLSNQLTVSNSITPSSCGGSNGVIELNIRGGFAPYQISWDDNASITQGRRTNLAAGTYEVTITDSVGCQIEKSIVLNEVASPLLTVESFVQASCGTANGSIVLSQLSNDYRYHWSHDGGITTNSAEGLSAGRYDIYAENGSCTTDTLSFYITSPGTDLNISVVETVAATCETTYDGAAEINISGGASPYTISWNDEQNQNIERASNLLPGTYTVLVTDASGCSAVKSVTVGTVNPIYIASFNKETPSCHTATDGSIEVVVAGGTGNYSYLWSTGASSKILTGIAAGTYSVEVFDNDECAVSESVMLIAPDSLSLQASVTAPRCYESANGSAELSINGGTAPYSVSWPDGNTSLRRYDLLTGDYTVEVTDENGCLLTQVVTVPQKDSVTINYSIEHASCYNANDAGIELTSIGNARSPLVKWSNGQRGPVLRNVTAGDYTATITDANGCATAFEFTITEPDLLELIDVEAAATKCNDASNGSITYEVKGGTAPYTYRWSDGAISKNRSGLRAGTYEVLVTDNAGCAIAESFEIEEPEPLVITAELTGVSCFGSADGQATVEVNGGTAPYQISWPDGGTTFTREDLTAGRYDVTITDTNNCSLTQRLTIDNINPIEIESISRDIPSCYQGSDGSISIEVAGGSSDYTISWENGAQGATITNIAAGTYAVTITDGNGCTFNGSIRLDDAAPINISQLLVADPICYDEPSGMVAVTPSGGSAPYKVIWEDGIEASERNDLLAGTHNFTIQDAEGCTTAYEVTLENPPLEELSNLPEIVYLCTGGYITLDAGNWDTYSWTSDNTFSSTEREVRIDAEGDYHIEVTNEAGCIDAHDIEVIKDDDLLQADFLLTSEAVVGDTVLIIDISWPMPSTVEWFNPDDKDFYLVSQEGDYQEVIFTRTGEFEMSMKANLDQCEAYVTKTINVLSQDEAARKRAEAASKSQGKLHLSTNIYPNPNYGTFRLEVEGNQQHDIDVRIVDLHKGYEYYQLSGKQQQKHVFNITDDRLPAGVYIAIIETKEQTITKRFVVK